MAENQLLGFLGGNVRKSYDPLKKYEEMFERGELLSNIRFSQSEASEGLFQNLNGAEIFLPKEEISALYKGNRYMSRDLMDRYYTVKITGIDRSRGRVLVSYLEAQKQLRPQYLEEIQKALDERRHYRCSARVVHFSKANTVAFVDILGLGIRGVIQAGNWSYGFVNDISKVAAIGDIIDVDVTGYSRESTPEHLQFICSRKSVVSGINPWVDAERKYPVHSNCIVRCTGKLKNNFLARIEGSSDEITVFGLYPDRVSERTGKQIVIQVGKKYRCYIKTVDVNKQIIRVKVLDEQVEEE